MNDAGLILKWRRDPVAFVTDVFKVDLDEWQKDGLISICNNKRTAFKASKGVGKTALLAMACWWFIFTRYDAKIADIPAQIEAAQKSALDGLKSMLKAEYEKQQVVESQSETGFANLLS